MTEEQRQTGESTALLERARQAAQDRIAAANRQRSEAIAEAMRRAATTTGAALAAARDLLRQGIRQLALATPTHLRLVDLAGQPIAAVPAAGVDGTAADLGAQRLYWAQRAATSTELLPPGEGEVALFSQPSYQGRHWLFDDEVDELSDYQALDNQVASVQLGPSTEASLFADEHSHGARRDLTTDTPSITGFAASSLEIRVRLAPLRQGQVALYDDRDYRGREDVLDTTVLDLRALRDDNAEVRSLRLGPSTAVTLFDSANLAGPGHRFDHDTSTIDPHRPRSLRVEPAAALAQGEVTLYERAEYQGRSWRLTAPAGDLALDGGGVGSLRVGPYTAVRLFARSSWMGASVELDRDTPSLVGLAVGPGAARSLRMRGGDVPLRPGQLALYAEPGFRGRMCVVTGDVSDVAQLAALSGHYGSARVGPGTGYTLFGETRWHGAGVTLFDDVPALATRVPRPVVSVRVAVGGAPLRQGEIALYEDTDYRGERSVYRASTLRRVDHDNGRIGSVQVGPNTAVRLYESDGLTGDSIEYTQDTPSLRPDHGGPHHPPRSVGVRTLAPELLLMSAALDGGAPTVLAKAPAPTVTGASAGSVALDVVAGAVFWILPSGEVWRVGLSGARPSRITPRRGAARPEARWSLALDPARRRVFFADDHAIGRVDYDGGDLRASLVAITSGAPAQLAVDEETGALFWNDGARIARATGDGGGVTVLHLAAHPAHGVGYDLATGLVYWIEDGVLMRVAAAGGTAAPVVALPAEAAAASALGLAALPVPLVRKLLAAQAARQATADQAAAAVAAAHGAADDDRATAQAALAAAQAQAAAKRAAANAHLAAAVGTAASQVASANAAAATRRAQANNQAAQIQGNAQQQAGAIRGSAQAELDAARRQQQG